MRASTFTISAFVVNEKRKNISSVPRQDYNPTMTALIKMLKYWRCTYLSRYLPKEKLCRKMLVFGKKFQSIGWDIGKILLKVLQLLRV
jgi:hypothetical protein